MTKVRKMEKVTKIKARIISKPHAHLQTMEKTCAKFQKGCMKLYEELRSQGTHCLYTEVEKVHKVEKVTKNNLTIISKPHAHPHTMMKTPRKK